MTKIILIGGGGHCHSCIDVIESEARFTIAGIVEEDLTLERVLGYQVLGQDSDLPALLKQMPRAHITVGQILSPNTRIKLYEIVKSLGAELPTIVSPKSTVSSHAKLGEGTIVMHNSLVNANSAVGANCIINSGAIIEHDTCIQDHCHIATRATINGNTTIGEGCFIGSGAIIREGVMIGAGAIIGAGVTVMTDIPEDTTVKRYG
jgi:sugar O-acyltransferase (sialic acid O-acetyltransferase NeuD family)